MPFVSRILVLTALTAAVALCAAAPAGAQGLRLGFADQAVGLGADPAFQLPVLREGAKAGAQVWRFELSWSSVATSKPPSLAVAADPAWTGYDWTRADRVIRAIRQAGLDPLVIVGGAPAWAQGSDKPTNPKKGVLTEGWKPSASQYQAFATALATRYSGKYPDPLAPGSSLPSVRNWQVWNEPNLSNFLNPQWVKVKGRYVAKSPDIYRALLNAFYAGVKKVSKRNYVITAGTAPFGDLHPGEPRMPPVRFWRELLCVNKAARSTRCGKRVTFDAIAHHPYPIGRPTRTALNADDVVVPDMWKLTRLVKAAQRAGTVRPAGHKGVWATEISWDSRPDPDGLPLSTQATWMQGAFYVLWKQGVDVITWWNMRDEAPVPSYAASLQSGIFFRGKVPGQDKPKPSARAFAFPFTAYRSGGVAQAWGKAPRKGTVTVQAAIRRKWVTVAHLKAGSNRIFSGRVRGLGATVPMRAKSGASTSLTWVSP